jgi:uncharacterized membrane protein YedE/YeeE
MDAITILSPAAISLALLMGFVADRTHLCSVHAVHDVLFEKRVAVLLSFVKIVLWVLAISLLLEWLLASRPVAAVAFHFSLVSMAGGILFGVGSVINDGCSLHTLTRLGRGNLGMAVSIVGLIIGVLVGKALFLQVPMLAPTPAASAAVSDTAYREILLWCLGIWTLVESIRQCRRFSLADFRRNIMAAEYALSPAAALVGITNGVLFAIAGTWMYTYTLAQGASNLMFSDSELYRPVPALLWWLLLAYLAGIVASSLSHHSLHLTIRPQRSWLRYLAGGLLMGLGASLVPGGNDVLLLNSIPGLSSHAVPAYLSMLAGIAIALLIQHRYFSQHP